MSNSFTLLPHSLTGKGKCHWVCTARQIACLINFISYHLSPFSLCSRHCLPCSFLFKHAKQTSTLHALYLFSCCLGYHFPDSCKVHFYPTFKSLLRWATFRKISHALYILNNAPIGFVIILIDLLSLPGILP